MAHELGGLGRKALSRLKPHFGHQNGHANGVVEPNPKLPILEADFRPSNRPPLPPNDLSDQTAQNGSDENGRGQPFAPRRPRRQRREQPLFAPNEDRELTYPRLPTIREQAASGGIWQGFRSGEKITAQSQLGYPDPYFNKYGWNETVQVFVPKQNRQTAPPEAQTHQASQPIYQREEAVVDLVGMTIQEFLGDLDHKRQSGDPFDESQEWNAFLRQNPEAVGRAKDFPEVMRQWQRIVDEAEKYREGDRRGQASSIPNHRTAEPRTDPQQTPEKPKRQPPKRKKEASESVEAEKSREEVETAYLAFHTLAWEDVLRLFQESGFKARDVERIRKCSDPETLIRAVRKQRRPLLGDEARDLFLSLPNVDFSLVIEHLERQRYITLKEGAFNGVKGYKSTKLAEPVGKRSQFREGPPLGAHFQQRINEEWERLTGKGEWTEEERVLLAAAESLRGSTRKLIDTFPKRDQEVFLAQVIEIDRERWEKWFPGRERPHPEADSKRRVEQREELVLPPKSKASRTQQKDEQQAGVVREAPEDQPERVVDNATLIGKDGGLVDPADASEDLLVNGLWDELPVEDGDTAGNIDLDSLWSVDDKEGGWSLADEDRQQVAASPFEDSQREASPLPDELAWVETMLVGLDDSWNEDGLSGFFKSLDEIKYKVSLIPDQVHRELAERRVRGYSEALFARKGVESVLEHEAGQSASGNIFGWDDGLEFEDSEDGSGIFSELIERAHTVLDGIDGAHRVVDVIEDPEAREWALEHASGLLGNLPPDRLATVAHRGADAARHTASGEPEDFEAVSQISAEEPQEEEPIEIRLDFRRGKSVIFQLREALGSNPTEQQYVRANAEQLKALVRSLPLPDKEEVKVKGFTLKIEDPQLEDLNIDVDQGKMGVTVDVSFKNFKRKNAHLRVVVENNEAGGFSYVGLPEISGFMGADAAQNALYNYSADFLNNFLTNLLNKQLGDAGKVVGYTIEDDTVKMEFKKSL